MNNTKFVLIELIIWMQVWLNIYKKEFYKQSIFYALKLAYNLRTYLWLVFLSWPRRSTLKFYTDWLNCKILLSKSYRIHLLRCRFLFLFWCGSYKVLVKQSHPPVLEYDNPLYTQRNKQYTVLRSYYKAEVGRKRVVSVNVKLFGTKQQLHRFTALNGLGV